MWSGNSQVSQITEVGRAFIEGVKSGRSPMEKLRNSIKVLEALRADGVQIVILDNPEIYSEYAPYSYIKEVEDCNTGIYQRRHPFIVCH